MFTMRFDMRAPAFGASTTDLYTAALEISAYAESRGAVAAILCEHHTMPDGYLPSPMTLATAIAARTERLPIMIAAIVLPLYNPVRLAEDMVVLDIISRGRVSYVLAMGYRPEEFDHLGVDFHGRGRAIDDQLTLLLRAKSGDPFDWGGRRVHVTPRPVTPGGPTVMWGGGSPAAARRAARFALGFIAQGGGAKLEAVYLEACAAEGNDPGFCLVPDVDTATTVFVSDDLDLAWNEIGPHLLHDVRSYAALNVGDTHTASLSVASTVDQLRAEDRTHRIITKAQAREMTDGGRPLPLQPLVGGLPPDLAWKYLHNAIESQN